MSTAEIIRAWKDQDYLMSLGAAELTAIPENPAGTIELIRSNSASNPDISFIFPASKCCSKAIDCTIDTHC